VGARVHSSLRAPADLDLPDGWRGALARIAGEGYRRVMVIGGTDLGKSRFVDALLAAWSAEGRSAWLVDADPGQKMIGPPGTASLGRCAAGELTLEGLAFVGTTSAAAIAPLAKATRDVAARAGAPVAINTSGLVRGPGVGLKLAKIAAADPDLLVAIATGGELEPILGRAGLPTIRLAPSPAARRKTAGERAARRRLAFASHLADARPAELVASPAGRPTLCLADRAARPLCAAVDRDGVDMALGTVAGDDEGRVRLAVPPTPRPIAAIRLGAMWARQSEAGWILLDTLLPARR